MEDQEIIELFFARSEQAIRELDRKYGSLCQSLSRHILGSSQDAEECVNDAYLGVWNAIPPARPSPLLAYLCKIVRNLSLMRYRAKTAAKRNGSFDVALEELADCLASSRTVEGELEEKELAGMIQEFLDELPKENRILLMRRYWFGDSYREIAGRMGISEKNVSVRLTRIRKDLRRYFEEKGVIL